VSIEGKDEKMTNRSRKIKFFLDKMKAQENQTDSVAKLVKDLIVRKAITWVKAAAPIIGLVLLLLVLVVAMIAVPVIAVIAILYNFDIMKHKQYPLLSDYDKKNEFDIEKYVKNRNRLRFKRNDVVDEVCDVGEIFATMSSDEFNKSQNQRAT